MNLIRQHEESQELRPIPSSNVSVELLWVPRHFDVLGNDRAHHTSGRARELQRNLFAVDLVEREDPGSGVDDDDSASTSWMPRGLRFQFMSNEGSHQAQPFIDLPRYPWDLSPHRPLDPGRVLTVTLLPADDLMIDIQLEEDRHI